MRMHEILGVEPGERFEVKGFNYYNETYYVDERGEIRRDGFLPPADRVAVMIINHPDRIIRKPRLTGEQKYALEAIYKVFGAKYVGQDDNGGTWGYPNKPRKGESMWLEAACVHLHCAIPVHSLVSWSDPEPLDIVQTLRDAGVEV